MSTAVRSVRQEQRQLSAELRARHRTWVQIAVEFRDRYHVTMRAALRMVRDWSQRDAAEQWNRRWPADPKTFKNFSYWELWPAPTGHAPSLDVLARLAELYECSVADLLADGADFRANDPAYRDDRALSAIVGRARRGEPPLLDRLDAMDVHAVARVAARLADRIGSSLGRRALLLKLSAALSLAAASPALADESTPESPPPATGLDGVFAGIWRSRYRYPSTGRGADFVGEHYVVLRQNAAKLTGQSVPANNGSLLTLDLAITGTVATGTWSERTSPAGYYRGSVYHGAIQLVIDPMGKGMRGRWIGFDREFTVNSDTWELVWVSEASTRKAIADHHFIA